MKIKKKILIVFIFLLLVITILIFTIGPLFPWSPLRPGYEEYKSNNYTVIYSNQNGLPKFYENLNDTLESFSNTLNLPIRKKIKMIRTTKEELRRFLPWMRTDGLGGVALQTGDVLYINYEQINFRKLNEEEFVKHEVIHLINHQNSFILNSYKAGSITYLTEGIAFYLGGPYFYSDKEFLEKVKKVNFKKTNSGNNIYTADAFNDLDTESADRYKISHMLYGKFIKYLINNYGQSTYNGFNKAFLSDPTSHRILFEKYYKEKLEVVLEKFETEILNYNPN